MIDPFQAHMIFKKLTFYLNVDGGRGGTMSFQGRLAVALKSRAVAMAS